MLRHLSRRFLGLWVCLTVLSLAACGQSTPAAPPTATSAPEPTRTPRPTREPTAEPTAEPEPTAEAEPTAASDSTTTDGQLSAVDIGDLQTYEHPSGVFQIDIPENWSLQDNSKPDELVLVWTDPTRNGGVIVNIFEDEATYDQDKLIELLNTYLKNTFGSQPDFDADEPTTQSDDSVLIAWSYTAKADNDIEAELLGNSFIEQRGNKVSILTTLVPRAQFDELVEKTDGIINTYKINTDAAIGGSGGSGGGSGGVSLGGSGSQSGEMPAKLIAVGESIEIDGLTLTVTGVEEPKGTDFIKPDDGKKFLIVRVKFENASSEEKPVSSLLQMALLDSAGTKYDVDIMAATLAEKMADGSVPAGGTLEGGAGFQVPADASGLVFVYSPLINGEPVGVALD